MEVQVISLKTVKEHQKQVVKVASIAGGTLKTILNALPANHASRIADVYGMEEVTQ